MAARPSAAPRFRAGLAWGAVYEGGRIGTARSTGHERGRSQPQLLSGLAALQPLVAPAVWPASAVRANAAHQALAEQRVLAVKGAGAGPSQCDVRATRALP
ncbi:hypothetical protein PLESTB_000922500 [Pleodorina starrii]|uniref:Uncharacterized protein n=1 Tax=Pleodorina starrii TaxID=330485 RepID=A0A9W6BMZ1_9CHLO|nr:hypothetical protein PLESTM_001533400 [Pleodorina starrii]GLC54938.1 hypothetical protein PLESTB_000922500 [Pleodorina starrii]